MRFLPALAPGLRSMRARMTALFALFVALLMLLGGAAVQRREERRAEKRTGEILSVARQRAQAELGDAEEKQRGLLQAILSDKDEIAAGGLVLMVVENLFSNSAPLEELSVKAAFGVRPSGRFGRAKRPHGRTPNRFA